MRRIYKCLTMCKRDFIVFIMIVFISMIEKIGDFTTEIRWGIVFARHVLPGLT